MHSGRRECKLFFDGRRRLAAAWTAAALASGASSTVCEATAGDAAPAASAASTAASGIDSRPIEKAVERLRADPLLAGTEKTWRLEFKKPGKRPETAPQANPLLTWLRRLAGFLADTSRLLLYGLALVLAAVFAVTARRFVELHRRAPRLALEAAATHVRGLDVRPESLPDDIGAAAWALWQSGEARAALSLLYRGALSRLIHRHDVPIAASSTEGECLALARGHLAPEGDAYFARLVAAWQAHVYGQHEVPQATGERLCREFGTGFDVPARAVLAPSRPAGAAP